MSEVPDLYADLRQSLHDALAGGWPVVEREYAQDKLRGLAALDAVCAALVYKPGWRLTVRRIVAGAALVIEYEAPDAYHPERGRNQKASVLVPEFHADQGRAGEGARVCQWIPWVASVLLWLEAHEMVEFFQPWGQRIYDPHDNERADRPWREGLRLPSVLSMPPPCTCPVGGHVGGVRGFGGVATGGNGQPSGHAGGGGSGAGASPGGGGGRGTRT